MSCSTQIKDSLRRLRLETLPMFYQHRADPQTPAEEVAQTIAELMKEGKVQRSGVRSKRTLLPYLLWAHATTPNSRNRCSDQ